MITGYISKLRSVITMVVLLFTCCFCSPNVFAQNCQPPGEQIIDFNEYPPNTGACTQASLTYHTVPTSSTANVIPLDITLSGGGYHLNVYEAYNVNEGCGSRTITATFSRPVSLATIGLLSFSNGDFTFTAGNQSTTIFVPGSGEPKSVSFAGEITSMSVTAGLDQNGFYNYALIGVSATPIPDPVPTQAGSLLVQGFGSPSIVPGSDILVNGENWQHNIPGLEYKLFLDNVFESSHPVVFCNQSPSFTVSLPCAIGVGNHAARVDLVKPTTQEVLASKQTTFSVVGFSIVSLVNSCQQRVQSVELKEFSNNDQLTPNRDPVSGMFIGKKIFPDKNFPQEALQQSANRRKVRVIATTTIDVPPGTKVFFKAYDVDDPESDGVIDPNGTTGDDNRGIPKQGSLSVDTSSGSLESMCPDMNGDCWARTNNNREAVVEFVVTMHAGDNFMIAASTDQANFMVDANGTPLSSNLVTVSEMLTVWRRLHVELDFMDKVAGNRREVIVQDVSSGGNGKDKVSLLSINQTLPLNQFANGNVIFGNKNFQIVENAANIIVTESLPGSIKPGVKLEIVDDDDFNSDDIVNKGNKSVRSPDGDEGEVITAIPDLVALFQESDIPTENVFARAYIIPILDGGGAVQNNTPNTSFQLNSDTESRGVIAQVKPYIQTANLVTNGNGDLVDLDFFGTDDFWITYVQICYQANELEDNDPDTEPTLEASTIVVETSDAPIVSPNDHVPLGGIASLIFVENSRENSEFIEVKGTSTIIPHEVGHQFGLDGDTNSTDIMGNRASTTHFLNKHLNIIRWRVHSPGKDR